MPLLLFKTNALAMSQGRQTEQTGLFFSIYRVGLVHFLLRDKTQTHKSPDNMAYGRLCTSLCYTLRRDSLYYIFLPSLTKIYTGRSKQV